MTIFLGILAAMAPLATDMYLPALPIMQSEFSINTSLIQMTLTMTMLGMAIGQIFAGPISDMRGRKAPLLIGMLVFMVSSLVCMVADNIVLFLAVRFVQGFSGACGIVIARAIARDICKGPELTRFFSILMMVNGLAPIIAPVLGGEILELASWRYVFFVLAMVGLAMSLSTIMFRETLPPEKRITNILRTILTFPLLIKNKYFLGHCLVQMFVFSAFFAYIGSSSFIFQGIYHVSPRVYSLIFGFIGFGIMIAGSLPAKFAGRIHDEIMLKKSLYLQAFSTICLIAAFYFQAPLWVIIVLLLITVMPVSVIGAASFSLGLSSQGRNAGSASALLGFSSMILGGVIMPVVGIFGTDSGVPMAVIMLISLVFAILSFRIMIMPAHR
ncbi:MAG: multidrug effflux MFS transporter [Anaerovibrio sp.]|nr:multidrug effflux MFS transporter [Anaerovibrio sp.]